MTRRPSAAALALATAVAAALVVLAGLFVLESRALEVVGLTAAFAARSPTRVLLALVVSLALLTGVLALLGRVHADPVAPLSAATDGPALPPDVAAFRERSRADPPTFGADIERARRWASDYDGTAAGDRERARRVIVDALRALARERYARCVSCSDEDARAAVAAGRWTDDARAGALLADEDGPSLPLRFWLVDLLTRADPFAHHVERTVAELEAMETGGPPSRRPATQPSVGARGSTPEVGGGG
ncbi:DUF7269 family protein [Natronobiforma cellulositropha]|uniref:DUF7269 family protein n=1 Tax=Natronobiforma cellulositropha TaxID=1679076 RepID=UPI0021D5B0EE|nr:hypothetical protein [Natronobiforma cellulositropha]